MVGTQVGNFEIMDEIGRGGMGIVYRARQRSLDRVVALKVLPQHQLAGDSAADRFKLEALAMARLSHPGIVDVIEVGDENGLHYFAMQYVQGPSLEALIKERGPLPAAQAVDLAAQIADALAHAHRRGVIHRDIKPANILMGPNARPVVTDFGIAKAADAASLTRTGSAIGTPEYMSPEVLKGNPIDGRADLYSLGVLLFQMVTGALPFTATTPFEIANRHLSEAPPRPSVLCPDCPQWLESIILRMLAKQPADRFASAEELAVALRAAVPVAAPTQEFVRPLPESPPTTDEATVPSGAARRFGVSGAAWAAAGLGVVLMLASIWILATRGLASDVGNAPTVVNPQASVPVVVGDAGDSASELLISQGFLVTQLEVPSHTAAVGTVVAQHPAGGEPAAEGSQITLTISAGPAFVVRPGDVAVYRDRDHDSLNMRASPGTGAAILSTLPYGGRVEVLGIDPDTEPGWAQVRSLATDKTGWVAVRNPDDGYQLLYPEQ